MALSLHKILCLQCCYSESQDLWASSIIQNAKYLENIMFWESDLFASSGEGRETPALLGPLEKANLSHWKNY
jgi:hypothetical protein